MLTTYLNTLPYTKFVLIEDSVTAKGGEILEYLLKNHENKQDYRTHLFVFERNFNQIKNKHPGSECHDFTSDLRNWMSLTTSDMETVISNLEENCVVVIDSLVHVLYRYGLLGAYQTFTDIKNKKNVQQIITVLHTDLLEDRDKVIQYFQHLSTLHMELQPKRVLYTYKKSQRKIIKQLEEYYCDSGKFITQPIKKPDKDVIRETVEQINPENMSTFKIGLSEKDKESRSNLVLPYLPKETNSSDGKIHYAFDDIDDWDEEDPDDDLDI
ncbi:hypothetical protein Zmor_017991 [Zophobas morio]|uniref:Elongator complex protein 5 n=1 Tax=Zophobas morio TaxID=2755281 RepID=A0AA38IDD0_9CUCU|nr:hypothetical protein Zmor_017991 [Zophobas morio]